MGPRLTRVVDWVWTNDPVDTVVGGFLVLGLVSVLLIIAIGSFWSYLL